MDIINTIKGRKWFKRILPNAVSKNSDSSTTTHSPWTLISEHAKTNYLTVKVKLKLSLCMPRMHTEE
jgi:hypothetical protein